MHIKAVNWFGFNNGLTVLDGLYSGGSAAASDMASITWQLRLLGFNGVRLPFLFDDVLRRAPLTTSMLSWCDPTTSKELAKRAIDPDAPPEEKAAAEAQPAPIPPVPLPPAGGDDLRCNTYLPRTTTLDRFLWVVQWFSANGFYVLLDYHPMGLEYTSYDTRDFVGNWTTVWHGVTCLPGFEDDLKGRVFLDLLNEPDSIGQRWEDQPGDPPGGHPGPAAGLTDLYLTTMDAIWAMTPGAPMFFLEGGGQTGMRGVNWGNGFATDKEQIARLALSDPNPFFERLMAKPYRRSVVISPHVYGPTVTLATDTYSGPDFVKMLDASFGYLSKKGFCLPAVERATGRRLLDAEDEAAVVASAEAATAALRAAAATTGAESNDTANATADANAATADGPRQPLIDRDCQRFPVAIGEFGSRFVDPRDLEHLNDFAAYLNNEGGGRTDAHNAIGSWAYWSFNPTSWDTGGIVDDSWQNLLWTKLRFLRTRLGLRPWYDDRVAATGGGSADAGQDAEDRTRELQAEAVEREWWDAGKQQQEQQQDEQQRPETVV